LARQGKRRREYACIFKAFDAVSAEIRPLKPAGVRSPSPYTAERKEYFGTSGQGGKAVTARCSALYDIQ